MTLVLNHLIGFGAVKEVAAGGTKSLTYISSTATVASQTTFSFTSIDFGAADAARFIIVVVGWKNAATARTISSATIGGVTATINVQANAGTNNMGAGIICAAVPSGTSGTIAVTFSGAVSECVIAAHRAIGLVSATANASASDLDADVNGVGPVDVNTLADGFLVAGSLHEDGSTTTWTGPTETSDADFGGGDICTSAALYPTTSQTPMTVTATNAGGPSSMVTVSASWA